jgi:hypothetical protein
MTLLAEKLHGPRVPSRHKRSARQRAPAPGRQAREAGFDQTVVTVAARPGKPGDCRKHQDGEVSRHRPALTGLLQPRSSSAPRAPLWIGYEHF